MVPKTEQHGEEPCLCRKNDGGRAEPAPTPDGRCDRLFCGHMSCAVHPALYIHRHCNTTSRSAQICRTYWLKSRLSRAAIMSVRSMPSEILYTALTWVGRLDNTIT